MPRQSPLRATPSRPTGTPPTIGKSTPPLTEWSPDSSATSPASSGNAAGLNKLELCQFYNVQQFPERDVPHEKQPAHHPTQHIQQPLEKVKSPDIEVEVSQKIMVSKSLFYFIIDKIKNKNVLESSLIICF